MALHILKSYNPELTESVDLVIERMDIKRLTLLGKLQSLEIVGDIEKLRKHDDALLLYYAKESLALWGTSLKFESVEESSDLYTQILQGEAYIADVEDAFADLKAKDTDTLMTNSQALWLLWYLARGGDALI